ncbi:MAG: 4-alpha-glucanotransferase [Bacteroidaceae bacterium]|nr:4-alpha-glucanotransferase [Bacteroidaceae bacterium]
MKIHFQIEYLTHWGERLYLCLNLGDAMRQIIEMDNNGSGTWFTDYDLNDDEFDCRDVTYSYMVQIDGNITRREEGTLHSIPYTHASRIVLSDRWKEYKGFEMEQRTVSIPYVRHNNRPRWKGAGTAIPVFSLRSENDFGIGEFTDLKLLVDWAAATGQSIIQTLPVNDTTMTRTWRDSYPYSANSSFALNPIYINLEMVGKLSDKAFLNRMEKTRRKLNSLPSIDYEAVLQAKSEYLDRLYDEFGEQCFKSSEYKKFFNANHSWLEPYSLYCYLRDNYGTADFSKWKEAAYSRTLLSRYCTAGNERYRKIRKHYFIQFHLHQQLTEVKKYANRKGILLKGDVPIGVNRHSADVWINPSLFHTDCQAGAPPDAFATDGQKWGMPTYNWENMARDNYFWFVSRFKKMADYFDAYRIDHLLGFFRIWEIPLKYSSGLMGRFNPAITYTPQEMWDNGFPFNPAIHAKAPEGTPETNVLFLEDTHRPGTYHPRINAFDTAMFNQLPEEEQTAFRHLHDDFFYNRNNSFWSDTALAKLPALIEATDMLSCGEDLGMIPTCVPEIMDRLRILSLEVQRMPKTLGVNVSDPSTYPYMSVCTTSTHDMSVLRTWIEDEMEPNHVIPVRKATTAACTSVISAHLSSPAMLAIFPLQDWLSMNSSLRAKDPAKERINVPANPDNNWCYRMHLTLEKLVSARRFNEEIRQMLYLSGR